MNFISYCPINLRCFHQILELPCFLNNPFTSQFDGKVFGNAIGIQATTVIVDMVIVESTALVEQKPLMTQFYLLLVESLF